MVSLAMRRVLVGLTAVAVALGWLQLAPAFGFPVTAPAAMLDRMLGANHEASLAGWAMLLVGELALAGGYFIFVEGRTRGPVAPIVYAVAAWLVTGAVLMPLIGIIQGAPPAGDAINDPMRANFFMLNLGAGAAAESLVAWLLFGVVLAAGRTLGLGESTSMVLQLAGAIVSVGAVVAAFALRPASDARTALLATATFLVSPYSDFFDYLNAANHAGSFSAGRLVPKDAIFFVTLTAGALFLTTRVVESRRWR